jgi:PAS domain S-box-containing protein
LIPVLAAAYNRRGLLLALLVTAFFVSALLPAALVALPGSVIGEPLPGLLAYAAVLSMTAYLAAMVADFLRTRQAITGAIRDWEALLEATSEPEEVIEFALKQAAAIGQARAAAVLARNAVGGQWELFSLQNGVLQRSAVAMPGRKLSLAQWLLDQAQPQILNAIPNDRRFVAPPSGAGQVVQSLLAQPLTNPQGDLVAMIVLLDKLGGAFSQSDFAALAGLVEVTAKALGQAGAYARADHILARRVQQLAALQRTARELNATVDPQAIVDETVACAMDITDGDVGLVSVDVPGAGLIQRTWNVQVDSDTVERAAGLAHEIQHPLLIASADDSFYSLLEPPGLRLVAPIRRAGRTFGLILVESARPQAFGEEALRTAASLADHAAVALDNTRLFHEIARAKRTSDEIIDAVADGLFTVDLTAHVTAFNPAAEALTGWRAEEATGHLVCDVLGCQNASDCQQNCDLLAALRSGQHVQHEQWTIRQRLGTQRVVALNAAPLPVGDGQDGGQVMLMRDITEAWELDRMQSDLITAFSHELRTPLTNIAMITEMMLSAGDDRLDALEREQLHLLQAQSQRLEEFADRILQVNRLDIGASMPAPANVWLNGLLEEIGLSWFGEALQQRLSLKLPEEDLWVWADGPAVQSVLNILLDNAFKYAAPDSPVEVTAQQGPPGYVTVAVADRGPGIAPVHQARLFNRFYRIDSSDAQSVYGYGLGLYIARGLITQMNGQIWVESDENRGSRFAFTLPEGKEIPDARPGN